MKIGVFGNCQTDGMAASIKSLTGHDVFEYTVQKARTATDEELKDIANQLGQCDAIFTQPAISQPFAPVSFDALKALCANTIAFPHIATTTLHPDCHYVRDNGVSQVGPMGPYHSAIIAACYLMGIPQKRVPLLFNKFVYSSLGYLAVPTQYQPMYNDAQIMEYDFSEFVSGARGAFMHTPNHPNADIIFSTAQQALSKAKIAFSNSEIPEDRLEPLGVWPVYPEIADPFSFEGSIVFKQRKSLGNIYSLEEVIEEFYKSYDAVNPIKTVQISKAMDLFERELI